jgi:hypothetical protein
MIKKYYYIMMMAVTLLAASCANDEDFHLKDIESNERSILDVRVPDQVGPAVITRTASETKVTVYVKPGTNLSAVAPNIQVSFKAKISPPSGETFNFSSGSKVYAVTSETGLTREWNVEVLEYDFDMYGIWNLSKVEFFYDVSEEYGSDDWKDTKLLEWPLPGAADGNDDVLEFILDGVTPEGNLYGTFIHSPGDDGKFPTFNWNGNTPTNFDYKFKRLPEGTGTWLRNLTDNTITFNKGEADQSVTLPLQWENDKQTLIIPFNPGPKDIVWDNDWGRMELQCTKNYWITLTKQE